MALSSPFSCGRWQFILRARSWSTSVSIHPNTRLRGAPAAVRIAHFLKGQVARHRQRCGSTHAKDVKQITALHCKTLVIEMPTLTR